MNRRNFLVALAGAPALAALITSCGDDNKQAGDSPNLRPFDDIVLRITSEGGFVPVGSDFVNVPSLLITGDGRVFTPGAITLQYPGPLLMPVFVRSITPAGIDKVIAAATDAKLLGPIPDYAMPPDRMIADAPDTVVAISVGGVTYRHQATALGFDSPDGGPSTPARDNLQAFVALVTNLEAVVGAENLGTDEPFVPEHYRFQAIEVDPTQWTEPSPSIVEWPADAGLALADATECGEVTATVGEALFADATQLTFFQEGDVVYQLWVGAVLPGVTRC